MGSPGIRTCAVVPGKLSQTRLFHFNVPGHFNSNYSIKIDDTEYFEFMLISII